MARQWTWATVPQKTRPWRRNRGRGPSPETLGTQQAARMGQPPGQRYRCRGVHLVQTVHHRRPPNCGASTCRRPCSAAGWTRRRTPSHSQGSREPGPLPAASPFSRLSGPPPGHRPPLTRPAHRAPLRRPAHQPSRDRLNQGRPPPNRRERRPNLRRLKPRRQKRCHLERCRLVRSCHGPCHLRPPSRPRRHPLCRWAAPHWRPRRHLPCLLGVRSWQQPRPRSHRPNPLRPRRARSARLHRPCPPRRVHRRYPLPRATAGPLIRVRRARALAGAAAPLYHCAGRCRPPSSHGGRVGLTASQA